MFCGLPGGAAAGGNVALHQAGQPRNHFRLRGGHVFGLAEIRLEVVQFLGTVGKEDQLPEDGSEIVRRFNEYFYGPQDYAVIGVKS